MNCTPDISYINRFLMVSLSSMFLFVSYVEKLLVFVYHLGKLLLFLL